MECEITPLNGNVVVEDITANRKSGGIITSSGNEKTCLKSYKVVAFDKEEFDFLCIGDEILCGEDDLKVYTYSSKRLYLIKGDYISGRKEKTCGK